MTQQRSTYVRNNSLYALILLSGMALVWWFRQQDTPQRRELHGKTMGTHYSLKWYGPEIPQKEVDSILAEFNQSLSTYIPSSEISRFNREDSLAFSLPYFLPVLEKSKTIFEQTQGAFDPTVMPLVNAWGFGPKTRQDSIPEALIDSLRTLVGFEKIQFNKKMVWKTQAKQSLDFSAIAKGYGVDVLAQLLEKHGVIHYLVEIGGEMRARGQKPNEPWYVGVEDPRVAEQGGQKAQAIFSLKNSSLATSGNYRNFYEKGGVRYAHTISPKTGKPVQHSLLSASVLAPDCMTADALATACMVLGKDEAMRLAEQLPAYGFFFVYDRDGKNETLATGEFKKCLEEN